MSASTTIEQPSPTEATPFDDGWIYKHEMELLLRIAGFARWQILGVFDRRPLLHETDAMTVQAWTALDAKEKT